MTIFLVGETGAVDTGIIDSISACHCHEKAFQERRAGKSATGQSVMLSAPNEGLLAPPIQKSG
jgi:hypothetical protein